MRLDFILSAALAMGLAQAALGDVMDGKAATAALFSGDAGEVLVTRQVFLTKEQETLVGKAAAQQPYYGAIAVSPDEGLLSEATIAAANYHNVEAASAAALAGCDAARKGKVACVVVALIRPKGWEPRPLQLSAEATAAFKKQYKGKGAAFAASTGSGAWGLVVGENAAEEAVAACAEKLQGPNDCVVVIAN